MLFSCPEKGETNAEDMDGRYGGVPILPALVIELNWDRSTARGFSLVLSKRLIDDIIMEMINMDAGHERFMQEQRQVSRRRSGGEP